MSRSSQSSRSLSSYSDKVPLSCQSDSKQGTTYDPRYDSSRYDPRYTSTPSEPRSGYSSTSSSRSSGRSSNSSRTPLSISRGSYSGESGSSKNDDARYYASSSLDPNNKPEKKPLSIQTKDRDPRYYQNSSYYR